MFAFIGKILGDVRLHRLAAVVGLVAVGAIGLVKTQGVDLGLDDATIQSIIGVLGTIIVVAREIEKPVLLKPIFDFFAPKPVF